jgi:two-component system, NarL family, response regulator LiaR
MIVRVLIVDDHAVVRQGLRMFLGLDAELEVVGEAENGRQAIDRAVKLRPDVVLMDLLMPVMDGIAATEAIRRALPDTEVIALTSALEDRLIFDAIRVGAMGYLLKDTRADDLCRAIKSAAAGQVQLSPEAAQRLVGHVTVREDVVQLTPREIEVLQHIARGMANKQIGFALGIAEKTVKTHITSIFSKLGVVSRTEAALYAVRVGLVSLAGEG